MMEEKVLVEALGAYEEKQIKDRELGRVPVKGERWEISKDRLAVLLGQNEYDLVFVKVVEEKPEIENASLINKKIKKKSPKK